jgi:hypothetical protein
MPVEGRSQIKGGRRKKKNVKHWAYLIISRSGIYLGDRVHDVETQVNSLLRLLRLSDYGVPGTDGGCRRRHLATGGQRQQKSDGSVER